MTQHASTHKGKPRKKAAAPRRKPARKAATRRSSRRKGQRLFAGLHRPLPTWAFNLLMAAVCVLFVVGFYYFYIRPYMYRWKPCYGMKAYGVCIPYGYSVHGIDISHHQGTIDWRLLSLTQQNNFPIRFIFMKASEGGDYADSTYRANFDSARVYGFIRGAYHFYNPDTDPSLQADFFIRSARLDSGDLPPVLDIEVKGRDTERMRRNVKRWLDKIEAHYGTKPILYTSYKFKTRYLNDSVFDRYPYWIAHYYVDSVAYDGAWKFWQHTDVGTLPGISEKVDLNIFNGTLEQLKALTLRSVPPAPGQRNYDTRPANSKKITHGSRVVRN